MAMAADIDPLSDRELSEEDGGDPVEEEVLETPTEVRLLVGTLVELILAGQVAEPGPLSWKAFQAWRAGAGGRPTIRRGDRHSLTSADESRIWRATMEALYRWIPREGQTAPPLELGDLTNRERALASYEARMARQEELRSILDSQPAVPVIARATETRGASAGRGSRSESSGVGAGRDSAQRVGAGRDSAQSDGAGRVTGRGGAGRAPGLGSEGNVTEVQTGSTISAGGPSLGEPSVGGAVSPKDSSEESMSAVSKRSIGSIRLSSTPAVAINQARESMNREFDPVRESEAECLSFLQSLFDAGVKLSGGDKELVGKLTERFFVAQAKLWLRKELERVEAGTEVAYLKIVVGQCVAGTHQSVYTLEVMTNAAIEMLRARHVDTSTRDGVIFSSSEHSGERSLPSPEKREDLEILKLKRRIAELTRAQEQSIAREVSQGSRGRSGSGGVRRRLDTPNSNSVFEGASSAGRGARPVGQRGVDMAEFGPSMIGTTAMTPARAQALADLKRELDETGIADLHQQARSLAGGGNTPVGGSQQDIALTFMTGLKEGFESLKSAMHPHKEQNSSIIKFSAPGKFPILEEHDNQIDFFKKEFHAMSHLSNAGKGMNPIEEITILKTTLRGCRLDYYAMVYDECEQKGMLKDRPQECLDLIWAKLESLKETPIEARMRLDNTWANIQHSRHRKTASEFEPVFVKIIRDTEKRGMAKSQQDYFLTYLRTVTNQEKAEIMRERRMRVDRENLGVEVMRVADSWEEAQALLKEQEVVVSSTRALDGKTSYHSRSSYNMVPGADGYQSNTWQDPASKQKQGKKGKEQSLTAQIAAMQSKIDSMNSMHKGKRW